MAEQPLIQDDNESGVLPKEVNEWAQDKLTTLFSIGLMKIPEYAGKPSENIETFLKEFGRATIALTRPQKCLALKRALVGDAGLFAKNYLKKYIATGEWKQAKNLLRTRFSAIDINLVYRSELSKMSYEPEKKSLLAYIDKYADLYRKIHTDAKDNNLIQDLGLNLGNDVVLKLNQLSSSWRSMSDFESFRELIGRLEKDIISLEMTAKADSAAQLAITVNKIVKDAISNPITEIKDLLNNMARKPASEPPTTAIAAVKNVQYPSDTFQGNGQGYGKRKERSWNGNQGGKRLGPESSERGFRCGDLLKAYEQRFGPLRGTCFTCGGLHLRKHCPLHEENLKVEGNRQ